jgi:hypothetical protein
MARLISILRWSSRITGLFLAGLVLLFAIGERFNPRELTLTTGLMSVAFFAAASGMLILWRWELIGGMIVVIGMTVFYVVNFVATGKWPSGWVLPLFLVPGLLAVISSGLRRRMGRV